MRKTVVVASPDAAQRNRLFEIVNRIPDFEVIARTGDLMNTYNQVEERLPKAVLIADVLADLPEFEVMRALFSTLDIRWLVVTSANRRARFGTAPFGADEPGSDLFSVPADAPETTYVQQLCALTRSAQVLRPAAKRRAPFAKPSDNRVESRVPAARGNMRAPAETLKQTPASANAVREVVSRNAPTRPLAASPGRGAAGRTTPASVRPANGDLARQVPRSSGRERMILIGASTGGVDALLTVLTGFPADCPPTLVVQHTGTGFGESLAGLLDRQCLPDVRLANGPTEVRRGQILIGAGIRSHLVLEKGAGLRATILEEGPVAGHVPSVDVLFRSAIHLAPQVSAAILTGMGRDGAEGMKALHDAGAFTIAQDEASCVVYGMPRAAVENNAVSKVVPLTRIGETLLADNGSRRIAGKEMQK